MKKKFSFLLAIVMIVCTLTIGLVACAPSDPDPFTAANSSRELGNIYDAWAKEHLKLSGNSMGIDAKINLKDSEKDLTILLQGGITINKENDDILRFAILDNKKTDQKETFEVKLNQNGLFVFAPDFQEKTIFAQNVFLELGSMLKNLEIDDFASLSEIIKPVIVELINGTLIGGVTVDPVKTKDGKFVVKYNFSISLYDFVEQIVYLAVPAQADSIMNVLASQIEDVNVDFAITTTGNNQEKVEKPKKGEHKYNYVGGTLTKLTMSAKGMDIDAKDIKIGTTIPTITNPNPEDCVLADDVLLVNHIDGTFVMKDAEGGVVATYDWTVDIDFDDVTDIVPTIIQCVQQKNAMPLINKMFAYKEGKLFVEVIHNCGDDCKLLHDKDRASRNTLTIAYDPSSFATDRVYVALNLWSILPKETEMTDVLNKIVPPVMGIPLGETIADILYKKTLSHEDMILSFSPTTLMKIEELKTEANTPDKKPEQATLSVVNSMLSAKENTAVSLPIKDIINTILDNIDEEEIDPEIISIVINTILPNVETAEIDAIYKQCGYDNVASVKDRFVADRTFFMLPTDEGETTYQIPIDSEINFAKNAKNIYDLKTNIMLYDNNGNINPLLSYQEIMGLRGATIDVTYDDIKGNKGINDQLTVIDVIAKDKVGKQTIALVLGSGRTTGALGQSFYKGIDNVYEVFFALGNLFGMDMSAIGEIAEFAIPEAVIELDVTLTEFEEEWTTENPCDENKTYNVGDKLGTTYGITLTYKQGETTLGTKTYNGIKPIEGDDFVNVYAKDGAVSAAFPFTLNYEFIGLTKTINVNVEAREEDIYTAATITGKVGEEIDIKTQYSATDYAGEPVTTAKLAYIEEYLKKSVDMYGEDIELIVNAELFATTYKVKFKKAGEYKFELLEETGKKLVLTFVIE